MKKVLVGPVPVLDRSRGLEPALLPVLGTDQDAQPVPDTVDPYLEQVIAVQSQFHSQHSHQLKSKFPLIQQQSKHRSMVVLSRVQKHNQGRLHYPLFKGGIIE